MLNDEYYVYDPLFDSGVQLMTFFGFWFLPLPPHLQQVSANTADTTATPIAAQR